MKGRCFIQRVVLVAWKLMVSQVTLHIGVLYSVRPRSSVSLFWSVCIFVFLGSCTRSSRHLFMWASLWLSLCVCACIGLLGSTVMQWINYSRVFSSKLIARLFSVSPTPFPVNMQVQHSSIVIVRLSLSCCLTRVPGTLTRQKGDDFTTDSLACCHIVWFYIWLKLIENPLE